MIDLHTHSTASDGTLTPAEIARAAAAAGLKAVALTDHDTVAGIPEARAAAEDLALAFVPGVEISVRLERGALHIVGLFVDEGCPALGAALDWAVAVRVDRNRRIAEKLRELRMPVDLAEVEAAAGGGVVGRPHFARAMVERGHVRSALAAFQRYLDRGKPAYISKERMDPARAMDVVRAAGGVPILAHPGQTKHTGDELEKLVAKLADLGLGGIEVHYSGVTPAESRELRRLAEKYGLVRSGGSDFHGAVKPGIALGRGPGSLRVPDDLLGPIADRAQEIRRSVSR